MVADRFLAPWDPDYHPQFHILLRDRIQEKIPEADVSPLEIILAHGGYLSDTIRCYATALEELTNIPTASVDIIFSNAVLEHIYDPPTAFKSLARVSKLGGWGFHQVDFRDHRSMEQPLEFLLMSEAEFVQEFTQCHGECGNRYRPIFNDYVEALSDVPKRLGRHVSYIHAKLKDRVLLVRIEANI